MRDKILTYLENNHFELYKYILQQHIEADRFINMVMPNNDNEDTDA